MRVTLSSLMLIALAGCNNTSPLDAALPSLPPEGGAAITAAGRLDAGNFDAERVVGPGLARPRRRLLHAQRQGALRGAGARARHRALPVRRQRHRRRSRGRRRRAISSARSRPFLQLGRTFAFDRAEVVRDGTQGRAGGAALLRARREERLHRRRRARRLRARGAGRLPRRRRSAAAGGGHLHPHAGRDQAPHHLHHVQRRRAATRRRPGARSATPARSSRCSIPSAASARPTSATSSRAARRPGPYAALLGRGIAYGLVPPGDKTAAVSRRRRRRRDPGRRASCPTRSARRGRRSTIKKGGTATREVDLLVGSDVADVTAQALDDPGRGDDAVHGTTEPGARVLVSSGNDAITVATAGSDGSYAGALPDGDYTIQAEGDGYRRSASAAAERCPTRPATVDLPVPPAAAARLHHQGHARARRSRARSASSARRRTRPIGASATRSRIRRRMASPAVRTRALGDSSVGDQWDHPVRCRPATIASSFRAGPSGAASSRSSIVPAAGAARRRRARPRGADAGLRGVRLPSAHEHVARRAGAARGPRAELPRRRRRLHQLVGARRALRLLAAARRARRARPARLGRRRRDHAVGLRPLHRLAAARRSVVAQRRRARLGRRRERRSICRRREIFDGLRGLGARVVQVNHPRAPGGAFSNFQQNFDRAGLSFDFAARSFGGNASVAPLSAAILGLADGRAAVQRQVRLGRGLQRLPPGVASTARSSTRSSTPTCATG